MAGLSKVRATLPVGHDEAAARSCIEALPSPDPLCPFCVVLTALPFPEYAETWLCEEHLPVARALQFKGWNADAWHQHLAALARWNKLPAGVEWWPQESLPPALGRSPSRDQIWGGQTVALTVVVLPVLRGDVFTKVKGAV
jgi:hypothetical protein